MLQFKVFPLGGQSTSILLASVMVQQKAERTPVKRLYFQRDSEPIQIPELGSLNCCSFNECTSAQAKDRVAYIELAPYSSVPIAFSDPGPC